MCSYWVRALKKVSGRGLPAKLLQLSKLCRDYLKVCFLSKQSGLDNRSSVSARRAARGVGCPQGFSAAGQSRPKGPFLRLACTSPEAGGLESNGDAEQEGENDGELHIE